MELRWTILRRTAAQGCTVPAERTASSIVRARCGHRIVEETWRIDEHALGSASKAGERGRLSAFSSSEPVRGSGAGFVTRRTGGGRVGCPGASPSRLAATRRSGTSAQIAVSASTVLRIYGGVLHGRCATATGIRVAPPQLAQRQPGSVAAGGGAAAGLRAVADPSPSQPAAASVGCTCALLHARLLRRPRRQASALAW